MTDRRYEPYIDMDRATEATRRRVRTAPPPVPERVAPPPAPERAAPPAEQAVVEPAPPAPPQPAPMPEPPREAIHWAAWAKPPLPESPPHASAPAAAESGETPWARPDPAREDARYGAPAGRRNGTTWLVLTMLAIGVSTAYLAYAAVLAPELATRPAATAPVVSLPDPLNLDRVVALPVVVPPPVPTPTPPPYPAALPAPDTPPYPAAPPDWMATPSAWTLVPSDDPPRRVRHRAAKPAHARKAEERAARHKMHDTRHPLTWYAD